MKKTNIRKNPFACHTCPDDDLQARQGKIRKWTVNICPGHIGLFVTAIVILIMQLMR